MIKIAFNLKIIKEILLTYLISLIEKYKIFKSNQRNNNTKYFNKIRFNRINLYYLTNNSKNSRKTLNIKEYRQRKSKTD